MPECTPKLEACEAFYCQPLLEKLSLALVRIFSDPRNFQIINLHSLDENNPIYKTYDLCELDEYAGRFDILYRILLEKHALGIEFTDIEKYCWGCLYLLNRMILLRVMDEDFEDLSFSERLQLYKLYREVCKYRKHPVNSFEDEYISQIKEFAVLYSEILWEASVKNPVKNSS